MLFGKNPLTVSFAEDLAAKRIGEAPPAARDRIAGLQSFMDELPEHIDPGERDLVMGFAAGYSVSKMRPFVESLRSVAGFRGDIVLFVAPDDLELVAYLRDRGIQTKIFVASDSPSENIVVARWFIYLDWIRASLIEGRSWDNILLTDTRDVIFQKKLFFKPCNDLEFHFEAPTPRIGECEWNSHWLRETFGEAALARFYDRHISCCGTVSGKIRGILRYLAQMNILMLTLSKKAAATFGTDQGVHNFIVHSGLFPEARAMENFDRVATLNHVGSDHIGFDSEAAVVNPDGSVSEIAHQWDRHPRLGKAVKARARARQRAADGLWRSAIQSLRGQIGRSSEKR